ncbi:hypothetical protein [Micromonospora sp. DT47]|uniref:hypothetical protein n=1 Tax=Micromonospora sp. DT47 TaxID=3393431 RepID=UPI003CF5226B
MPNAEFDPFNEGILDGTINLSSGTAKCALVRSYTYSAAHKFVSDVTGAGGVLNGTSAALSSKTFTLGVFDADDTSVTATASAVNHGLLLFQSSAAAGGADVAVTAQRLIAYYDTGTGLPIQPGTGTVAITWPASSPKILKVG